MVKRLLSATASEVAKFSPEELKQSIKANEGRTVLSENIVACEPLLPGITNAEISRSFGADLILLNVFDVFHPVVLGMYDVNNMAAATPNDNVIYDLKKYVGRPIGINLEPVSDSADMAEDKQNISNGRVASKETLERANELGFDFICLTGNPGTGVTNAEITKAIKLAKKYFDGIVIAGKMHGSGVNEAVVDLKTVEEFLEAGTDILLVPAVGTVWGLGDDEVRQAVKRAHEKGTLVMSAIGTSQESAQPETVREIAIRNKILGVDIQHIGDGSYAGVAPVENIFAMSKAIRGERHTVAMMARSIYR
ncbi:haloacid dehalogenase-like hydrolase [Paraliobacillus salinarum]|uniref:DUF7916 family protein n=1 Tax=Paraliobacillus salinarum TaxID=1158996 RepID=UPI0015F70BFA|nr:haloacid dehalogenase-like hydrolase [Paraliobacillus salinarum]